jgi:hypothetical protein
MSSNYNSRPLIAEVLVDGDSLNPPDPPPPDGGFPLRAAGAGVLHRVDRIVLLAGDADFVPAAKLARREGVDFILDPMHAKIGADLYEHIDGLVSMTPRPGRQDDAQNPHKDFTFNAEWSSKGFSLSGSGHLPWTTADPGGGQFSLFRSQPGTPRSGQAAEDGSTEPEPAG